MSARSKTFTPDHPVVVLFVLIAVVSSMFFAAGVLKPLALSVLFALALTPAAAWLERRRMPRTLAVVLTVLVALGALSGVGYVVLKQLNSLAGELPKFEGNITEKIQSFGKQGSGNIGEFQKTIEKTAEQIKSAPNKEDGVQKVRIVGETGLQAGLTAAVGPALEFVGAASFVLILTLFMMITRENLGDRVIQLFGRRQISLTTKTMDEVSQRITRYLTVYATVNTCYGIVIGTGLHLMGIPYAVLWGFLAAITRFVPYAGPLISFSLPSLYAFAAFGDWYHVLGVVALFGVVETILNSFLEPILYGRTTGVTALGLLIAAMFWTWLWGLLGLILSTPITVSLAVLGKYVPSLRIFATLLGEDAELPQDLRLYQRLLALDEDGANLLIEEALKTKPRAEVFEKMLLPTLAHCERDHARGEIEDRDQAFVWRVVGEVLDTLEGAPEIALSTAAQAAAGDSVDVAPAVPVEVAGVPADDHADTLVLRMVGLLLDPKQCRFTIHPEGKTPLTISEQLEQEKPGLVLISHMPPSGLSAARYLVQRLRARDANRPILVGRWGEGGDADKTAERLASAGGSAVVFCLTDARDRVQDMIRPKGATQPDLSPALAT